MPAAAPPFLMPLDYAEVRERLLDGGTALIEYMLGPDYSVALLDTADSLAVEFLPGREELRRLTGNYLRCLSVPGTGAFGAPLSSARISRLTQEGGSL